MKTEMEQAYQKWSWKRGQLTHESGLSLRIRDVVAITRHGVESLTPPAYDGIPEEVELCQ